MMETCRRLLTCTHDGKHLTDSKNLSAVHPSRHKVTKVYCSLGLLPDQETAATIVEEEPEIALDATGADLSYVSTVNTTNGTWPTLSKDLLEDSFVEISILPQHITCIAGGSFGSATPAGGGAFKRIGSWSLSQSFSGKSVSEASAANTRDAQGDSNAKFDSKFAFLRDKVMMTYNVYACIYR